MDIHVRRMANEVKTQFRHRGKDTIQRRIAGKPGHQSVTPVSVT